MVDAAAERIPNRVAVVMTAGEVFLAILKRRGPSWAVVRANGEEIAVAGEIEVWGDCHCVHSREGLDVRADRRQ